MVIFIVKVSVPKILDILIYAKIYSQLILIIDNWWPIDKRSHIDYQYQSINDLSGIDWYSLSWIIDFQLDTQILGNMKQIMRFLWIVSYLHRSCEEWV